MITPGTHTIQAADQLVELVIEPPAAPDPVAALKAAGPGETDLPTWLPLFHTGISSGPVNVVIDVLLTAVQPEGEGWEDIHEVSLSLPAGRAAAGGPGEETVFLGDIASTEAGEYRFRVFARGRDQEPDQVTEAAVEDYLVQIWAEPTSAPRVISASSSQGKYWANHLQ